jgi:manganese/zinc/iron transport system permease protein
MLNLSLFTDGGGMHAWAIATAAMVAAGCALVGTLLVVRRMSLVGDAISHAVLPGIVVAVLAGGRPGGVLVLVGAVAAALLTVWLTQLLRTEGGLAEDAGAGVTFTTLFALGVVLVTAAASRIDLDPACVLHGMLELVPFDTLPIAGVEVPRAFLTATVVFVVLAVGAILVVAMLVVPAATAELLTRRLHRIAVLSMLLGVMAAGVGYLAAWWCNTSAAGMIAVVLGIQYLICVLLSPDDGVVARLFGRGWFAWRVACEDRLAACWRAEEITARGDALPAAVRPTLGERLAASWLAITGRVTRGPRGWVLTARGREQADMVVRSHRLWEAWLGRHAELPLDHLHPPAEWIEHHLGADVRRRIEAEVGMRSSDPHGRSIPPEP